MNKIFNNLELIENEEKKSSEGRIKNFMEKEI